MMQLCSPCEKISILGQVLDLLSDILAVILHDLPKPAGHRVDREVVFAPPTLPHDKVQDERLEFLIEKSLFIGTLTRPSEV